MALELEKIFGTDSAKEAFYKTDRNFQKIDEGIGNIDVSEDIQAHDTSETSHSDIREQINDLRTDVGDKTTLTTTDKTNLVNAVNENRAQINNLDADVIAHKAESTAKHITESGSNANGSYIKFDDGTLICYKDNFDVGYSKTDRLQSLWTWPASFATSIFKPFTGVIITNVDDIASVGATKLGCISAATGSSTSTVRIYATSAGTFTEADKIACRVFAIGRWK